MNEGRPVPLHGQAAGVLVDFAIWQRGAFAEPFAPMDGATALRAVPILLELAPLTERMAMALETIATIAGSRDGVEGQRPLRLFAHILRRARERVALFPGTIVEA